MSFIYLFINNDQFPQYMWGPIQVWFSVCCHLPINGDKYFKLIWKVRNRGKWSEASSCVKWQWGIAAKSEVRWANNLSRRRNKSLIPFCHKPLQLLCLNCLCPLQCKTFKINHWWFYAIRIELLYINFHVATLCISK